MTDAKGTNTIRLYIRLLMIFARCCSRSVQMRLYTMHKREFVMVFLAFFACFGLGIFVGITGPPITSTVELDGKSLLPKDNQNHTNKKDIATGPFTMRTPPMTTYSQQLWVIAKLSTENIDGEKL